PPASTSASFLGDLSVINETPVTFGAEKLEPGRVCRHPTRTSKGKPSERAGRKATDLTEVFPTIAGLPMGTNNNNASDSAVGPSPTRAPCARLRNRSTQASSGGRAGWN